MWRAETEVMVSLLSLVWEHLKLSDVSLGTRTRLIAVEDVKKRKKQANYISSEFTTWE